MDPNQTCEILLSNLKQSNLNFSIAESPFAVTINLKKTFIKDQNGVSQSSGLSDQNPQLIGENFSLRNILSDQTNRIFHYQQMVQTLGISL